MIALALRFITKKQAVTVSTVEKWIVDHDKVFNTATWMKYEKNGRLHVSCNAWCANGL